MSKYIDVVIATLEYDGTPRLYEAPAFSHLSHGDEIMVEGENSDERAYVVGSNAYDPNSDEFKMLIWASDTLFPLPRVLAKVVYSKFEYPEEKENE